MCVIIVNSKKSEPLKEELLSLAWLANPHGGGLMYSKGGKLHTVKRMRPSPFIEEYYKAKREAESDVVLHFRIATSGNIDSRNCHPFLYDNMAIMHNGILPIKVPKDSPINDTQLFVKHFMQNKLTTDPKVLKKIAHIIGFYNKFVIMDNTGTLRIVNRSAGYSIEGDWFSNLNFLV